MSVLCLVRHGQASIHGDDYDRLSDLGEEQGRRLGEHWAAAARRFDRVYVGPLRRQRQTLAAVAAVYRRRGLPWPDPEPLAELDEHHGLEVLRHYRSRRPSREPASDSGDERGERLRAKRLRAYLEAYRQVARRWIEGELETPPGLEPWADFRRRVEAGIGRITDGAPRGLEVAAFTSGGATAAAVGLALGLDDETVLELSWRVRNGALTELLFSPARLALDVFNATPHLSEALKTFI